MLRTAIAIKWLSATSNRPARLKASTLSSHPVSFVGSVWAFDCDEERYTAALTGLLPSLGIGGRVTEWVAGDMLRVASMFHLEGG